MGDAHPAVPCSRLGIWELKAEVKHSLHLSAFYCLMQCKSLFKLHCLFFSLQYECPMKNAAENNVPSD